MKKARIILVLLTAFILVGTVAFKRIVRSASATSVYFASSATISGQVFNDKNGNAVKEAGDNGLQSWTVFIDQNNDGVFNNGEIFTTTDANGNYGFTLPPVPAGSITVKVREVLQAGWLQTTSNPADIIVTSSGGTFSGRDFGNFQKISISGQVYNDANGNGSLGPGESVLTGWTVFLDTNGNGGLDNGETSTVTSPSGTYSFANLGPGTYKVREVVQNLWMQTTINPADIAASSGTNIDGTINAGLNFGNFLKISISGQVYDDLNGSGFKSTGEPGLPGWLVFIDTNGNGAFDNGEPGVLSDAQGNYGFHDLGPGTYKVREVVQSLWVQTSTNPADVVAVSGVNVDATTNAGLNFANFKKSSIIGKVFDDTNGNGTLDAGEPGLSGWTVSISINNSTISIVTNAQGSYSFGNLTPGAYPVVEQVLSGWSSTHNSQIVIPTSGSTNVVNLGEFKSVSINGTVYVDQNGNAARDAGEPGQAGWTVQLMNTSNQVLTSQTSAADGSYSFANRGPGTYRVREVAPAGWVQTTTIPADITAASGVNQLGVDFGNFQKISISGRVFNDQNGNGTIDTGEPGMSPWTVFLDSNSNGALDNGEPSAVTNVQGAYSFTDLGPGTYKVRAVIKIDETQTSANPLDIAALSGNNLDGTTNPGLNFGFFHKATVSGKVFEDINGNGFLDAGEPALAGWTIFLDANSNGVLDAGENSTSTDSSGNYHFDVINSGTFRVREVLPAGWSSEIIASFTLLSGTNAQVNLGEFKHGSITGTVFNDQNGNGVRDAGESGRGGWTVQLMNTANTVLASQATAADGSYSFTIQGRGPGTYRVREVVQAGFTQTTTNPADIVPTSGMSLTINFGNLQQAVIQFSQSNYTVAERGGTIQINVVRTGDTSGAVSVDYATDDGSTPSIAIPCSAVSGRALERCDYTRSAGTLSFAPGETQKSFIVLVNDDSYAEGAETLQLVLSNPLAANLGPQSTAILQITDDSPESSGNPVDDLPFFIRQHYHDFLNREPDQAGLDFWTGSITSCGSDAACREVVRINDSAAFFLSIEFQQTGYLVERLYKVGYGDATGNSNFGPPHTLPVPVVRLREFLRDTQQIGQGVVVGASGWEQLLETNKQAFVTEFVSRQRFTNAFTSTLTAQQFVTQLDQNVGQVLSDADKAQLMGIFGGPSASSNDAAKRALVLRQVAENSIFQQREFNRAFVLMQFFGYLRRNPDDAQDTDYSGFDFWLTKLNQFNGNFIQAEMVKAFITSAEYRQRFGQQ